MNNIVYKIVSNVYKVLVVLIIFLLGFVCGNISCLHYMKQSTPVENNHKIDSLSIINNNIKNKIKELDSVKNEEVIKVKSLDNHTTLKLLYELVSE